MSWIKTISTNEATGRLKTLYERIKGPHGNIDNVLSVHSLRPHTLEGHMALYKNVLHHAGNSINKWFLEAIGVWVSVVNACDYCAVHHYEGMRRLLDDEDRAIKIRESFSRRIIPRELFTQQQVGALEYACLLTNSPADVESTDIDQLRELGYDDGEILEINQVVAYFCYANRTVLGLGVTTKGDEIGLSPGNSENPDDWSHS